MCGYFQCIVSSTGTYQGANQEILQAHIRCCVKEGLQTEESNSKIEEALQLLEKMNQ